MSMGNGVGHDVKCLQVTDREEKMGGEKAATSLWYMATVTGIITCLILKGWKMNEVVYVKRKETGTKCKLRRMNPQDVVRNCILL